MANSTKSDVKAEIAARAKAEGFEAVRVTKASLPDVARDGLTSFVAAGHHGSMGWMEAHADRRGDPHALWPAARSIIVLGANYGPAGDPADAVADPSHGAISVYAQGDDYHEVLKARLRRLARFIAETYACEVKLFVDTAPVMEKPLAQQAGLGWQGKHTNLVSRDHGSWLFLASIFTTLELPPDASERDHCGRCRDCLDACPTNAFPAPYQLDARRCISYLTIEHKGQIPHEFRRAIGNRIYGCDDCLAACPWNKFASVAAEAKFHARQALTAPALAELARLDDAGFRALFRGSPIKRIGRDRFLRNVLIAIGNSADPDLAEVAEGHIAAPSALVRGAAVWALRQLAPHGFAARAADGLAEESDADVRAEWTAGLETALS